MNDLANAMLDVAPPDVGSRTEFGTVTATGPLLVRLDSATVGVPTANYSSATLAVSDRVAVVVQGATRYVLGKKV